MKSYFIYVPVYYPESQEADDGRYIDDAENFYDALKKYNFTRDNNCWQELSIYWSGKLPDSLNRNPLFSEMKKRMVENRWIVIEFRVEDPKHISTPAWEIWEKIRFFQMAAIIARPHFHISLIPFYVVDGEYIENLRGICTNISNSVNMDGSWPSIEALDIWRTWNWISQFPGFFKNLSSSRIERALCAFSQLFHSSHTIETTNSDFFWSMIGLEAIFTENNESIQKVLFEKLFLVLGRPENYQKQIQSIYQKRSRLLHGQMNIPNKFAFQNDVEAIDDHFKLIDSEEVSVRLLVAILQYLVKNDIKDIEFSKQYQIQIQKNVKD